MQRRGGINRAWGSRGAATEGQRWGDGVWCRGRGLGSRVEGGRRLAGPGESASLRGAQAARMQEKF